MTRAARCPVCRKPADPQYRPFCSRRCADVDLARWLRADYVVPGRDGEAPVDRDIATDFPDDLSTDFPDGPHRH